MMARILLAVALLLAVAPAPAWAQAPPPELSPAALAAQPAADPRLGNTPTWIDGQPAYATWHGLPAVVFVQASNGGGSGTFYRLVLAVSDHNLLNVIGWAELGDRVIIERLYFDGRLLSVDLVRQGPNDAACCPTERVRAMFGTSLQNTATIPTPPTP